MRLDLIDGVVRVEHRPHRGASDLTHQRRGFVERLHDIALSLGQRLDQDGDAALRGMGGTVGFDPSPLPNAARPIVNIDLHHTKATDADLERLQALARLRSLNLNGTGITDAGMRYVGGLVALQTLLLNETRVGDAGLRQLQHLTELRELSLFHTHVTDDGLALLKDLAELQTLDLSGTQVTGAGLAHLAGLQSRRRQPSLGTLPTPLDLGGVRVAHPVHRRAVGRQGQLDDRPLLAARQRRQQMLDANLESFNNLRENLR